MNEEEVYNLDDCQDEVEDERDKIKLDMQDLLRGENTMDDVDTMPTVNIVDDENEEYFDRENNPNTFARRKSKAELASDYIQKMKSRHSFLSNADSETQNAGVERDLSKRKSVPAFKNYLGSEKKTPTSSFIETQQQPQQP